jgi:hypothetical protein
MARIDWDSWRRKFIQGPDTLTIKALSEYTGAPAYQTLRNRSSKEDWVSQRKRYRDNLSTISDTVPDAQQVASRVEKIIDSAEMLTRHSKAAKLIGSIALKAFQTYDPATLKPSEATQMMKLAVEVERITEGLATERQEMKLDLKGMSDAELQKLIETE